MILVDFCVNNPWFLLIFCYPGSSGWQKWNGSATLLLGPEDGAAWDEEAAEDVPADAGVPDAQGQQTNLF